MPRGTRAPGTAPKPTTNTKAGKSARRAAAAVVPAYNPIDPETGLAMFDENGVQQWAPYDDEPLQPDTQQGRYVVTDTKDRQGGVWTVPNQQNQGLIGLDHLRSVVQNPTSDPLARIQAARALAQIERHAIEKIEEKQLHRRSRSDIQAMISASLQALRAQGLDL